jgi:hypothetical protein
MAALWRVAPDLPLKSPPGLPPIRFAYASLNLVDAMNANAAQLRLFDKRTDIGRWLAEGERLSERYGGRVSAALVAAKTAIFPKPDPVSRFVGEVCQTDDAAAATAGRSRFYEFSACLFARYIEWCGFSNEPAMSLTCFGRRLSELGFPPVRRGHGRRKARIGIKLKDPAPLESA